MRSWPRGNAHRRSATRPRTAHRSFRAAARRRSHGGSRAVSGREILVLVIFAATLAAVLFRPRNLSEGAAAALGGGALVLSGGATPGDVEAVIRDNLTVFAFFLGMMAITTLAEQAGVFDRMAAAAARLAYGSPRRLFFNIFLLGTAISTFLTNDATALILTPVVYALVTRLQLDPLPYVFACTFIADTASMTLPISNPINIILGQRFQGLALGDAIHYLLAPSLAAIAINIVAFAWIFRARLGGRFTLREDDPRSDEQRRAFAVALVVLGVVGLAFVGASAVRPSPIGAVAIAGALALVLATRAQGRLRWKSLAAGISWSIFPFIAGMFLLVRGLEHQGVTHQLGDLLSSLVGTGTYRPAIAATFFAAVSSNAINNVPAVAVITATIPTIHHVSQPALVYGSLIGCDLGPNLTVVGSLSTMIWLLILRQRKMEISALTYARLGIMVTPVMLLVSALLLGLLLG